MSWGHQLCHDLCHRWCCCVSELGLKRVPIETLNSFPELLVIRWFKPLEVCMPWASEILNNLVSDSAILCIVLFVPTSFGSFKHGISSTHSLHNPFTKPREVPTLRGWWSVGFSLYVWNGCSLFLSSEVLKKNGGSSYESASLTYSNIILMSAPPLPIVLVWENYLPCGVPPMYPASQAVANLATSPTPILLFSSLSSTLLRSPTLSRGSFGDLSDKDNYYHLEPLNQLDASVRGWCRRSSVQYNELVNSDNANFKWAWFACSGWHVLLVMP